MIKAAVKDYALRHLANALAMDEITQAELDVIAATWRESDAREPTFLDVVSQVQGKTRTHTLGLLYHCGWRGVMSQDMQIRHAPVDIQTCMLKHLHRLAGRSAESPEDILDEIAGSGVRPSGVLFKRFLADREAEIKAAFPDVKEQHIKTADIRKWLAALPKRVNGLLDWEIPVHIPPPEKPPEEIKALASFDEVLQKAKSLRLDRLDDLKNALEKHGGEEGSSRAHMLDTRLSALFPNYEAYREIKKRNNAAIELLRRISGSLRVSDAEFIEAIALDAELCQQAIFEIVKHAIKHPDYWRGDFVKGMEKHAGKLRAAYGVKAADRFLTTVFYEFEQRENLWAINFKIPDLPEYTRKRIVDRRRSMRFSWFIELCVKLCRRFAGPTRSECAVLIGIALGKPEIPQGIEPGIGTRLMMANRPWRRQRKS